MASTDDTGQQTSFYQSKTLTRLPQNIKENIRLVLAKYAGRRHQTDGKEKDTLGSH